MPSDISVSYMPRTCQIKCSNMYNMNSGLLPVPQGDATGATPRTPEILNSLMAMTNPFDMARHGGGPRVASSPPSDTTSTSSSSGCSVSPPSIQHTCSQLIKEGLKLTIQTKRRNNPSTSTCGDETPHKPSSLSEEVGYDEKLTPEDEERRRRRRERNKIAATKCRLKKRERTVNLVQESQILETQNMDLKSQIEDLENERKRLVDMLSVHRPSCSKQSYNGIIQSGYQEPTAFPQRTVSSSVETSPVSFPAYSAPYCKVEVSCESSYHKSSTTTVSDNTYQRLEPVEDGGYPRASAATYHTFEQGAAKVAPSLSPLCRQVADGDNYMRQESGYTTLSIESSHSYLRLHGSPRSFSRPSNFTINTSDYKSNKDGGLVTNSYHHFDEDDDNYTTGFTSGSCIT